MQHPRPTATERESCPRLGTLSVAAMTTCTVSCALSQSVAWPGSGAGRRDESLSTGPVSAARGGQGRSFRLDHAQCKAHMDPRDAGRKRGRTTRSASGHAHGSLCCGIRSCGAARGSRAPPWPSVMAMGHMAYVPPDEVEDALRLGAVHPWTMADRGRSVGEHIRSIAAFRFTTRAVDCAFRLSLWRLLSDNFTSGRVHS